MKNKNLLIGGAIVLGTTALIYGSMDNGLFTLPESLQIENQTINKTDTMPKANITIKTIGVQGFPLQVKINGIEQKPNEKNVVEIERAGSNITFEMTALKDTRIQLILNKKAKDDENGRCGENIVYTEALINGKPILSETVLKAIEPVSYTVQAPKDSLFDVRASWQKGEEDKNCIAEYTFNTPIENIKISGLSGIESWGRWSNGEKAEFIIPNLPQKDLQIVFGVHAFLGGKKTVQNVEIFANDEKIGTWHFERGLPLPNTTLNIPAEAISDGTLKLGFKFENPLGPKDVGISGDSRKLGVGFKTMYITEK